MWIFRTSNSDGELEADSPEYSCFSWAVRQDRIEILISNILLPACPCTYVQGNFGRFPLFSYCAVKCQQTCEYILFFVLLSSFLRWSVLPDAWIRQRRLCCFISSSIRQSHQGNGLTEHRRLVTHT